MADIEKKPFSAQILFIFYNWGHANTALNCLLAQYSLYIDQSKESNAENLVNIAWELSFLENQFS